jgi:hypothetical protein
VAGPVPSNDRVLPAPLGGRVGLVIGRRPATTAAGDRQPVEWVIGDVDEWMTDRRWSVTADTPSAGREPATT